MPDHYKELIINAPLLYFGMVVGKADLLLESIPTTVRVVTVALLLAGGYYDIKSDIRLINYQMVGIDKFMNRGDRCTLRDCKVMSDRIGKLEDRLNGK